LTSCWGLHHPHKVDLTSAPGGTTVLSQPVQEVRGGVEPSDRQRSAGGGDKPTIDKQPGLLEALDALVWPETRGHPMSPLRWTLTSTYELARQLTAKGFTASAERYAP